MTTTTASEQITEPAPASPKSSAAELSGSWSAGEFLRRLFDWPARIEFPGESWMAVEEFEDDGTLVVRAELPDMKPEDFEVSVSDHRLHIRAERREKSETKEKEHYRSEFRYGSYRRSVTLPPGATEKDVKAMYKDGILEVRVPIEVTSSEARKVPVELAS